MHTRYFLSILTAVIFSAAVRLPAQGAITYNTIALSVATGASLGLGPNIEPGKYFTNTLAPVINSHGQVAFLAGTTGSGQYSGVWLGGGGSPTAVARLGSASPGPNVGAGISFSDFEPMWSGNRVSIGDDGSAVFIGKLSGTGISTSNDTGIWMASASGINIVAREGGTPGPNSGAGINFGDTWSDPFAPASGTIQANALGQVAFFGLLRDQNGYSGARGFGQQVLDR